MADHRKETPDFFKDNTLDPVDVATGYPIRSQRALSERSRSTIEDTPGKVGDRTVSLPYKKKAGFYLSSEILERFNLKFYELKLAGVTIENKSNLLELVLAYALDDIDKGRESCILNGIAGS